MYKNLTVRMDEKIKSQFDKTLDDVGLNASVAVNMFARLVIREKGIPFSMTAKSIENKSDIKENKTEISESVQAAKKLFGLLSDNFDLDELRTERLSK